MFIMSILILWLLLKLEAPIFIVVLGCFAVTTELVIVLNDVIVKLIILANQLKNDDDDDNNYY